jgi:hypothetical protein
LATDGASDPGPHPTHGVHVDPAGQLAFLDEHYLAPGAGFVAEGGGKVKVVVGSTGSGKTHFLRAAARQARRRGFLTVEVDATATPLAGFDHLYRAVAANLDLAALGRRLLAATLRRAGYGEGAPEVGENLVAWCQARGHEPGPVRVRLQDQLHRDVERNPDLEVGYARGLVRWCEGLAWGAPPEDALAEGLAERWLRGERLPLRDCNRLRLSRAMDRFAARLWLRSLLHAVRMAGWPGLVVAADNAGVLLQKRRPPDAPPPPGDWGIPPPALPPYYTAQKAADFYEMLRTVIDESGLMPGFLLILAGPPDLMTDERRGIPSYAALAERLRAEVETVEVNRFADVIVPERLWAADPGAGRVLAERLAEDVAPGAPAEVRDRAVAAALAQWQVGDVAVSAVRRSVLAVLDAAGGGAA